MTHSTEFTPSEAEVLRVILSDWLAVSEIEPKEPKDEMRVMRICI